MRAMIGSVSGPVLLAQERDFLREVRPWGVILMGRSCVSRGQVRALTDAIREALGRAAPVFIDQEGGRVARLKVPEWPHFPAAGVYGAVWKCDRERALAACELGHRLIGQELIPIGVNADCAPVLDLRVRGKHAIVGDRAFGGSPEAVIALAGAALRGLAQAGVAGVIKHMPGHGRARVDSHETLPIVKETGITLRRDLAPFRALAKHALMGMTAHIAYAAYDAATPATLSPRVIGTVIRKRIGFDGLLMTDDLGMKALGGSLGTRAAGAIAAGCDVALHCAGFVREPDEVLAQMRAVADGVPELAGKPLERARAVEATLARAPDGMIDTQEGLAQLRALLAPEWPR
jgi:beta-N-acetylhexosaminidase